MKDALVQAQHRKCCFCESQVGHDGDVEHFRPKSAVCQAKSQPLQRPGYYWLAYEWSNLLLCCSACNQRFKRNLFPLLNPAQRARQHGDDVRIEQPVFVHPAEENPEEFISFRQEIPYAINGNQRGKRTIEALGLNREIMNERRREHLKLFSMLEKVVAQKQMRPQAYDWLEVVAEAEQWLLDSSKDSALFTGTVRAKSRGW